MRETTEVRNYIKTRLYLQFPSQIIHEEHLYPVFLRDDNSIIDTAVFHMAEQIFSLIIHFDPFVCCTFMVNVVRAIEISSSIVWI